MKTSGKSQLGRILFYVLLVGWTQILLSQNAIKVSGMAIDSKTNETVIRGTIQKVGTNNYAVADIVGYYCLF